MIEKVTTTVYRSSVKGRRYFSLYAAINAETKAIIFNKHPIEKPEYINGFLTYPGYCVEDDEPERYKKMFRRLRRIVAKSAMLNERNKS